MLMEDSAGIYIIPTTIIENRRKSDNIGMTTRKIKERLKEQMTDIKLNRTIISK